MLYNWIFGCHGSMCYVILIIVHSIGTINVCIDFEINRYIIDEFRKHANVAIGYRYIFGYCTYGRWYIVLVCHRQWSELAMTTARDRCG